MCPVHYYMNLIKKNIFYWNERIVKFCLPGLCRVPIMQSFTHYLCVCVFFLNNTVKYDVLLSQTHNSETMLKCIRENYIVEIVACFFFGAFNNVKVYDLFIVCSLQTVIKFLWHTWRKWKIRKLFLPGKCVVVEFGVIAVLPLYPFILKEYRPIALLSVNVHIVGANHTQPIRARNGQWTSTWASRIP